ncbi:MAG: ABC transporter ATP-binding protein [Actinobacteria bacterium]|nr:ABC transporter ATP-binding protein [Actinomycetota bacterium]
MDRAPERDGQARPARPVVTGALRFDEVSFTYAGAARPALECVSFEIEPGQVIGVVGRSGSGKTTLLNAIGGLDRPTAGHVTIDGTDITEAGEGDLLALRRERIGFIFQTFGLLPILTAAENVEIPLRLRQVEPDLRNERVRVLLELVGLGERADHRPHELSGGEQQRVAIARALANSPDLLIADEPTGQLDSRTGRTIMTLLRALVDSEGVTAVVATHDPALIDVADRIVELRDGRIVDPDVDPSDVPGVGDLAPQPRAARRPTTRAPEGEGSPPRDDMGGGDLVRAPKRRPPRR